MSHNARDLYLSALDSKSELNARRLAELSHIPDDDPMWVMLHELQRSARELTTGANAALANDVFAQGLSTVFGSNLAQNDVILAALTAAIDKTHEAASGAIRSLEAALRKVARRRAAAPLASLAFAFALGMIACCAVIWGAYRAGTLSGYDAGYQSGHHDGILHERNRK